MARNNDNSNGTDSNDERGRLYLAALKGDWKSIADMQRIQRPIGRKGETTLHIAAAANQEEFVKKLLTWMTSNNYNLRDVNGIGNTALTYTAAVGNVNIAEEMLKRDSELPNLRGGVKPLFMAAFSGQSEMVDFLYSRPENEVHRWEENQQAEVFITCVKNGLYGVALKMLKANHNLATASVTEGETALHVLSRNPSALVSENQSWLKLKRQNSKQSEANELLENCLHAYKGDVNNSSVIEKVLFDAAEAGNIECLIKLIRFDFDLLWKTKGKKSIFHVAVEKRHESIFKLLNEIGTIGDLIVNTEIEDIGNILHLAADLAPKEKLNAISGAALQMQREMLWFKDVEKVVPPAFKEMKNKEGEKPYALFERTHDKLRTEGEKWMINTANYSIVVAALIGSTMFSGQIADGLDHSPNLYLVFSVASTMALFSSSTSIIMFLSIITSRYSYNDFGFWLPLRLLIGVATLCISIAATMVAFFTSFMLKNLDRKELPLILAVISLFACAPIIYGLLKWHLFVDIARSTFLWCKPRQHLLYKKVSHESSKTCIPRTCESGECLNSESSAHCINLACIK